MALYKVEKNQTQLFKEFYEKTGIQLTDEPINKSGWERDHLEELAIKSQRQPRKYIPILERLIEEKPTVPALKNYLQVAYNLEGNIEKVVELSDRIIKEHPTYVFGISNKIKMIQTKEEMQQVEHLLGASKDVRDLEGYDKPIHISAFKNYQAAVALYYMVLGEDRAAVERFETLLDLGIEKEYLDLTAKQLVRQRMQNMSKRAAEMEERTINAPSRQKVHLEQSKIAPQFVHKEVEIFYKKDIEQLSERERNKIMALPRTTLIADLERILIDAMKRYQYYFIEDHVTDADIDIVHHALYFLGALEAKESLPIVLDLLRMGEGFTENWLNPMNREASIYPTLYALGNTQLELLKAYVLEEELYGHDKLLVSIAVCQIALHEPDRRAEVLVWYASLYQYLLDHENNNLLIDTTFIGFSVIDVLKFRGKELLPLIEQIYAKGWIPDDLAGDIRVLKTKLESESHPRYLDPLPQDIHEYYTEEYKNRKAPLFSDSSNDDEDVLSLLGLGGSSRGDAYLMNHMFGGLLGNGPNDSSDGNFITPPEPFEPIIRTAPKVGRNDPCPCGSGKKYKKCCLRK